MFYSNVKSVFLFIAIVAISCNNKPEKSSPAMPAQERPEYAIVIHGGAGTIKREYMSEEMEAQYKAALNKALDIGVEILKSGGSSLDAVEQTINSMEDSPLFNSGKGAVFTHEGKNELDASIMKGDDHQAGAVGGVTTVKNPISAAIAVMEKSPHVMMVGSGAEAFAETQGLEMVDNQYFYTKRNWETLQNILKKEEEEAAKNSNPDNKFGTVGCVALDQSGLIVAGTSTGGMTNKKYNRIGDSPIIGAGTYADNNTCGVSCTGHGEYFIRHTIARDVSAMMEFANYSVQEAAEYLINEKLTGMNALGGLIAMDQYGNIAMPFNTSGMYRGYEKDGERVVKMYKD